MYCGKDFTVAAELRRYIKLRAKYTKRNLTVHFDLQGK